MINILKILIALLLPVLFISISPNRAIAQEQQEVLFELAKEELLRGEVLQVLDEGENVIEGRKYPFQKVKVRLSEGSNTRKELVINYGDKVSIKDEQKVKEGEKIVLIKFTQGKNVQYQIVDKYRLDKLGYIVIAFFLFVLILSRLRGLGAIAGLAISLGVIVFFVVPQILAGHDPLLISILGSLGILLITIYLAHGFSKRTTVALFSTFISLALTGIFAVLYTDFVSLTGLGNEGAYALRFGPTENINFKGLLLGGMIIGTLGVLDDITTSLSAAVFELAKANPKSKIEDLIHSGLRIGREHVSSLVNTLVLAYAGVGLPLFLFVAINPTKQPLWAMLNSEFIVEEIVRSLVGSIGLILAVPITVVLAAWFSKRAQISSSNESVQRVSREAKKAKFKKSS